MYCQLCHLHCQSQRESSNNEAMAIPLLYEIEKVIEHLSRLLGSDIML